MTTPTVPKNVPRPLPLLDEDLDDFDDSFDEEDSFRRILQEDFE